MTVDYKIRIENGGVSITQHVDAVGVYGGTESQAVGGSLKIVGTSFASCKGAAGARAAGQGGNAAGDPPPGGNAAGDPPPGGNAPASGQIVIFGPVVVDATGLVHKCLTEQPFKEKHGEK